MTLEAVFQLIESLAVLVALGFGVHEVRRHRRRQWRESALELLHTFQSPDFAKALNIVYNLPDGLSRDEIEDHVGEDWHIVYAMMTTWESVGILVHRGDVSLDLVDDFFSGPIMVSWRKLQGHVFGEREQTGRQTVEEWFQWLVERLEERESSLPPVPAHIEYKDWTPPKELI